MTPLIFERNHSWNQSEISSIFEVCLCLGETLVNLMISPDDVVSISSTFVLSPSKKSLASLTATITVRQSDFNAAVQKQKDSWQLGSDGVLGWLRYVSTKAQVGFWQIRRFLNISYDELIYGLYDELIWWDFWFPMISLYMAYIWWWDILCGVTMRTTWPLFWMFYFLTGFPSLKDAKRCLRKKIAFD